MGVLFCELFENDAFEEAFADQFPAKELFEPLGKEDWLAVALVKFAGWGGATLEQFTVNSISTSLYPDFSALSTKRLFRSFSFPIMLSLAEPAASVLEVVISW